MGHKYLYSFYPFSEAYLHTSPPNFFVINFPMMFLQVPDHPAKPLATTHELVYNHMSGSFLLPSNVNTNFTAQSSPYWEHFPSPLSFRDVLDGTIVLQLSTF